MPFRPQMSDSSMLKAGPSITLWYLKWDFGRAEETKHLTVTNKITPRLLKQCVSSLRPTAAECVLGDPGWHLSMHPAAPSPLWVGWGKKIGKRGTRKLVGLNKDTDSGIKKQRWQTFKHLGKAPFLSLVSCPCYHHRLHSVPLARQWVAQDFRVRV